MQGEQTQNKKKNIDRGTNHKQTLVKGNKARICKNICSFKGLTRCNAAESILYSSIPEIPRSRHEANLSFKSAIDKNW